MGSTSSTVTENHQGTLPCAVDKYTGQRTCVPLLKET